LHFDAPISASLALLPPEEFEEPRAGRVALGGYVVFPEAPEWRCVACAFEWRSEEMPSGTLERCRARGPSCLCGDDVEVVVGANPALIAVN
jgi:hypothetical protein